MSSLNVDAVWKEFKRALEDEEPWDVVDKIIQQNLLVLEERFEPHGRTPLNYLCDLAARTSKWARLANGHGSKYVIFDVIERLMESFPQALTIADGWGNLPLHYICRCGREAPLALIQCFVNHFPDSVKTTDKGNELALSIAVRFGSSLGIIQFLCEQYREAALSQDDNGKTPLHYLCEGYSPEEEYDDDYSVLEIIERVIDIFPQALTVADKNGFLPLHTICYTNQADFDVIQLLVKKFPDSVRAKTRKNQTALHFAFDHELPVNAIEFIYQCYPEAELHQNDLGLIPLHYACFRTTDIVGCAAFIERLIERCPKALMIAGNNGLLPLHHICSRRKVTLDLIQLFVTNFPDSVKAKTRKNKMPLHFAVECDVSLDVIQFLYQQYPEAVLHQDDDGSTPLHSGCCKYGAAKKQSELYVIERLVEICPEALTVADSDGCLPLHRLCHHHQANLHLIQLFVNKSPDSVKAKTRKNSTALHFAVYFKLSLDVIEFLYQHYPEAALCRTHHGWLPLHYACHLEIETVRCVVIERLIERYPTTLTVADHSGLLPLHHICTRRTVTLDLIKHFVNNFHDSVKAKTCQNKTPLHYAVLFGLPLDIIQFLCEHYPEAALYQDIDEGLTPLQVACSRKRFQSESLLHLVKCVYHACPKAARIQNSKGFTPLHSTCANEDVTLVQFLLERDPALVVAFNEQDKILLEELCSENKHDFEEICAVLRENSQIYECFQNAALALLGKLVHKNMKSLSEMEPQDIAEHLAKILETRPFPTLQQLHSPNIADKILCVCTKEKVYDDLQALLYTPTFQTLLKGYRNMIRLDQLGYLRDDPGNKAKCVVALRYIGVNNNSNVHLLFQQLRENSLLCNRLMLSSSLTSNDEQQARKRKRKGIFI